MVRWLWCGCGLSVVWALCEFGVSGSEGLVWSEFHVIFLTWKNMKNPCSPAILTVYDMVTIFKNVKSITARMNDKSSFRLIFPFPALGKRVVVRSMGRFTWYHVVIWPSTYLLCHCFLYSVQGIVNIIQVLSPLPVPEKDKRTETAHSGMTQLSWRQENLDHSVLWKQVLQLLDRDVLSSWINSLDHFTQSHSWSGEKCWNILKTRKHCYGNPIPNAQCMAMAYLIYLHLGSFGDKCRQIYHTLSIWESDPTLSKKMPMIETKGLRCFLR